MRSNPAALRTARETAGRTQPALAEKSGVSQQRISELEAAAVPILPTTAKRLAKALGVDISDITTTDVPEAEDVAS